MKKVLHGLLILLFALNMDIAWAVRMSNLYEAEVLVPAQTEDTKEKAIRDGLLQVLIKLCGDPQIINNPTIKANLDRADYFVQEFSYSPASTSSSEYMIKVKFNVDDIQRLLKKAEVSYWGESRPLILVWLVVTNPKTGSDLIGTETAGEVFNMLLAQSKKFGLPVIFPVMDVTDLAQVTPNDVAAMSVPLLAQAGKRYQPDALLIGNIELAENDIQSQWQLVLGKDRWSWAIANKHLKPVIKAITSQVSQTLSQHYVVQTTVPQDLWVKLQVNNVKSRNDLLSLIEYFKGLASVQNLELVQVKGETVLFSMQLKGSLQNFQEITLINHHLQLKSQNEKKSLLFYEWVD